MPWCPVCKNEYKEGYTACADCGSELVDELTESDGSQEPDPELMQMEDETQELSFEELLQEEEDAMDLMESAADDYLQVSPKAQKIPVVYQNKREKAAEYRSSAWALLVVGVVGMTLVVINELGVLPFHLNFNKFMVYGVMGIMFTLFILLAVYSLTQSSKILAEAETEDILGEQIKEYLKQNFTREKILEMTDEAGSDEKDPSEEEEESLYFARTAQIKKALFEAFADADEDLLEHLADEYYEQLFS